VSERGMGDKRHNPAALPPGQRHYKWLGGRGAGRGYVRKMLPHTEVYTSNRPARSESLYW